MPMTRRNPLLMNPDPNDPKDFSGEEYRGKVRGFPGFDARESGTAEQYVRGGKYGVDDWNLAEADAKKWLKENKQSKASLDHMREVFLKGILLERWERSLESGPATGDPWTRTETGGSLSKDSEWGSGSLKHWSSPEKKKRERIKKSLEEKR